MAPLSQHQSTRINKILYIGDSGTGKTGSLASLVADGYKLRILDMDAGVGVLRQFIMRDCPDKIENVDVETRRDKYKSSNSGAIISGTPVAFTQALSLMTKWSDGTDPATWGEGTIFVLDSLSAFSKAAFEWAKGMNPTAKDPRQWYFSAQGAVENTIALLTGEAFATNVIVISHVNISEQPDGSIKGHANAIGKAMGPILPRYFNNLILSESKGSGANVKRLIKTVPTGVVDLKTAAPFKLDRELPLEIGMATIFAKLKETN
jgi:hypothetical protein